MTPIVFLLLALTVLSQASRLRLDNEAGSSLPGLWPCHFGQRTTDSAICGTRWIYDRRYCNMHGYWAQHICLYRFFGHSLRLYVWRRIGRVYPDSYPNGQCEKLAGLLLVLRHLYRHSRLYGIHICKFIGASTFTLAQQICLSHEAVVRDVTRSDSPLYLPQLFARANEDLTMHFKTALTTALLRTKVRTLVTDRANAF